MNKSQTQNLKLNPIGLNYARNQARIIKFIQAVDSSINFNEDKYLGDFLLSSEFLKDLLSLLSLDLNISSSSECFHGLQHKATESQIKNLNSCSETLDVYARAKDSEMTTQFTTTTYCTYITWLAKALQIINESGKCGEIIDFNDNEFIHYEPTEAEIKTLLQVGGLDCLQVDDINKQLLREPKFYENNLWALYTVEIMACISFQVAGNTLPFYLQSVGATATQLGNLSTYFSLVQLFMALFWLWVSDIIGRKPVLLISLATYMLSTGLYLVTLTMDTNESKIALATGVRAFAGSGAILVPISYTIATDLAPPKLRGFVMVLINCFVQVGNVIASGITVAFSNSSRYANYPGITLDEIQRRVDLSFRDTHVTSVALYTLTWILCLVLLKESHTRVNTERKLKKIGIKASKSKAVATIPIYLVVWDMIRNPSIMILWFSYICSVLGAYNTTTGDSYYVARMYGFTSLNESKGYYNQVQIVARSIGVIVSAFISKPLIKYLGEVRTICADEIFGIFESLLYFCPNAPIPPPLMYLTMSVTVIAIIFCDSIFLQLITMYTVPQNRGRVLGIFQLGNSVGRSLSGVITGNSQDINLRDAQLFNTIFKATSLFLLAFFNPPLQRTDMDQAAKAQEQKDENDARI